jgi:hypothetical protein
MPPVALVRPEKNHRRSSLSDFDLTKKDNLGFDGQKGWP